MMGDVSCVSDSSTRPLGAGRVVQPGTRGDGGMLEHQARKHAQGQQQEDRGEETVPLLATTVDIAPGKSEQLLVYPGDDAHDVAMAFCQRYGLPDSVVEPLTQHVLENLEDMDLDDEDVDNEKVTQKQYGEVIKKEQHGHELQCEKELVHQAHEAAREITAVLEGLSRPSSSNCSLGTQYYGRAELPVVLHRSAEAEAAPAADRLYADHFRKQMMLDEQRRIQELENQLKTEQVHCTAASKALAAHRTADGYSCYGERLYEEGVQGKLRKEEAYRRMQEEREAAELAQATFHPEISSLAQRMKRPDAGSAWLRLHHKNASIAAKKEAREAAIRKELEETEMKECSFQPKISIQSSKIMERRRGAALGVLSSHTRLHNQGVQMQHQWEGKKKRLELEDITFKPEINRVSEAKAQKFYRNAPSDVADRLLIRGQVYQERLEEAKRMAMEPVDPKTGRRLFQPKTYRGPVAPREVGPEKIGDHLYKAALESAQKVESYVQATQEEMARQASAAYVNDVSQRMMERLKLDRIKAIYAYLSRTPDECYTVESFDIIQAVSDEDFMDTIDSEVRADVEHAARLAMKRHTLRQQESRNTDDMPSLSEMTESSLDIQGHPSVHVTEKEFIELINEVIQRTRGFTRKYLLPMPGTRKKWEEPTFTPSLDPHSLQLASKLRPEHVPSHDILYGTATQTASKIAAMKKEAESSELAQCTFKPEFYTSWRPQKGRALPPRKQSEVTLAELQGMEVQPMQSSPPHESSANAVFSMENTTDKESIKGAKDSEHISLYDGIDSIEREIQEALAQLDKKSKEESMLTKLRDSIDYKALFGEGSTDVDQTIPEESNIHC